jgi:hypothetical protein
MKNTANSIQISINRGTPTPQVNPSPAAQNQSAQAVADLTKSVGTGLGEVYKPTGK